MERTRQFGLHLIPDVFRLRDEPRCFPSFVVTASLAIFLTKCKRQGTEVHKVQRVNRIRQAQGGHRTSEFPVSDVNLAMDLTAERPKFQRMPSMLVVNSNTDTRPWYTRLSVKHFLTNFCDNLQRGKRVF